MRDSERSLIQLKSYNKHSIQYHTIFKMRVSLAAVLLLCASAGTLALPQRLNGKDGGNIYALLVAGSNTWMNYRHQVFVCVHISDYVGCVIVYCATVVDLWKFLCRLICAMPIRSSRSMECRTKTLWS